MSENIVIVIVFGLILLGIFYGIYSYSTNYMKKNNINLAEYIDRTMYRGWNSFILMGLIGICFAEGAFAAFGIPTDTHTMNPVIRLLSHVAVALVSVFVAIGFSKFTVDFVVLIVQMYSDKAMRTVGNIASVILSCALLYVMLVATFIIPYLNLLIVAVGLDKEMELSFLMQEYIYNSMPFIDIDMKEIYYNMYKETSPGLSEEQYTKLALSYSPGKSFGYPAIASFIAYIAHLFLAIIDGLYVAIGQLIKDNRLKVLQKEKGPITSRTSSTDRATTNTSDESDNEDESTPEGVIRKLVSALPRYENMSPVAKKKEIEAMINHFYSLTEDQMTKTLPKMIALWQEWKDLLDDKESYSGDDFSKEKSRVRESIHHFFRTSPTDGGFGRQLKGG